jgi:hypothetical protein
VTPEKAISNRAKHGQTRRSGARTDGKPLIPFVCFVEREKSVSVRRKAPKNVIVE